MEHYPRKENEDKPKKKLTMEQEYNNVEIKNREKVYFENVFRDLCALEKEPSSQEKNNQKNKENPQKNQPPPVKKNFEEDKKNNKDDDSLSSSSSDSQNKNDANENVLDLYKDPEKEEEKLRRDRFGKNALKKILKKLTGKYNKKDIELMIWEVDTNLNGYISFDEYERIYKKCVIDKKEREPKKLFTLIQFLMFDKEHKGYITEEDTLEILCIRNKDGLDNAINDIFMIEVKDEKGNIKRTKKKKETINYEEFSERMHSLSLRRRTFLMNQKKIFCDKVKEESMKYAKTDKRK